MGVIQSAINQALGTAGIAARLSPGLEKRQELHRLGKQAKTVEEQLKLTSASLSPGEFEEGRTVGAQQAQSLLEKQSDIAQKQFDIAPTKENLKNALFSASGAGKGPLMTFKASPEEIMQEQEELRMQEAMQKVAKKQDRQLKQKRNFMSYLKDQPTSFGGTVGDLPLKMQKQIAKQYSSAERKKLMNQMDKEKKDGTK